MGCTHSTCCRNRENVDVSSVAVRDDFKIGAVLGSGAFGQVRECVHRSTGHAFAIKIMVKASDERGHWSNANMFRREISILQLLQPPDREPLDSLLEQEPSLISPSREASAIGRGLSRKNGAKETVSEDEYNTKNYNANHTLSGGVVHPPNSPGTESTVASVTPPLLLPGNDRCYHPYIIRYHQFYEDRTCLYAVLEKCYGGELFDRILKNGRIDEPQACQLAYQMLMALKYVHSQGVVHRDIKAENFLFLTDDADSGIKLIDFGMSEKIQEGQLLTDVCGSPHYLAPELIRRKYNFKADVWALGVLMYLMLYGKYPFDGSSTSAIVKEILSKKLNFDDPKVSQLAQSFIKYLLQRNASKRPTAKEALRHPWLAEARARLQPNASSPRISSLGDEDQVELDPASGRTHDEEVANVMRMCQRDLIVIGTEENRYSQRKVPV